VFFFLTVTVSCHHEGVYWHNGLGSLGRRSHTGDGDHMSHCDYIKFRDGETELKESLIARITLLLEVMPSETLVDLLCEFARIVPDQQWPECRSDRVRLKIHPRNDRL